MLCGEGYTIIYYILLGTLLFFSRLQEQRSTEIVHSKGECGYFRYSEISWNTRTRPNGPQLGLMSTRTGNPTSVFHRLCGLFSASLSFLLLWDSFSSQYPLLIHLSHDPNIAVRGIWFSWFISMKPDVFA